MTPNRWVTLMFACVILQAQDDFSQWIEGADYAGSLPAYEQFLGFAPGEELSTPRDVVRYLAALAEASDRVILRTIGQTYQGRDMVTAVVSSPENLARLDEIRAQTAQLVKGTGQVDLGVLPATIYLAYGVHGNEHSSTDAALLTAYHLAADRSVATAQLLEKLVVIIEPMQNPDGRMRFINDFENARVAVANPDPNAVEHNPGWISGRTNHYNFDLNRDWFPLSQQETRHRVAEYFTWNPQVLVDFHEMGHESSYYFAPPAEAIHPNTASRIKSWWQRFGEANARAFDARDWTYFTGEIFDAFYPGYGESIPTFNGAVGMTYEQASASGLTIGRRDRDKLTLAQAILHHFVSGLTTLQTAAAGKEQLLADFRANFKEAISRGGADPVQEYILPVGPASRINIDLAGILEQLKIEILQAQAAFTVRGAADLRGNSVSRKRFPAGTLIIRTAQPRYFMLDAILEPHSAMGADYIKQELERQNARLPSTIYDVTAWSLPFAYDTEIYTASSVSKVRTVPADLERIRAEASGPAPKVDGTPYAYLVPYTSHHALQALAYLWNKGAKVRMAGKAFSQGGRSYPRGSLVLFPAENGAGLAVTMGQVADKFLVDVTSASSGMTEKGIDLGSPEVVLLKRPRVLMLYAERPISVYSYGAAAWLMSEAYGFQFTSIWPRQISNIKLSEYDVLILPHAQGSYDAALGESARSKIKRWVRSGGTVIGLQGGAAFLASNDWDVTSVVLADDVRPEEQTREKIKERKENGDKVPREHRPQRIPGAIFRVDLSPHHYLTYGYDDDTYVQINSSYIFLPSEEGYNVATFPEGSGMVSGFAWEGAEAQLSEKAYLVDEPLGRGHVILFADDPNTRGYWRGLSKLFMNAVFLSPSLRR